MKINRYSYPNWLNWVLILAIALGVCFRFVNLDRKIFWHDEVYTVMRAAGYTRGEIDQEIFQNKVFVAADLQKFQQIKPGSTPADTVQSLKAEDPQHPPLYFLMARFWMGTFGNSIFAARLLPALLSLLSLPLMYLLAIELFAARLVALLATALLALSPFDVLFAQTERQYGLLATAVIGSTWLLLRALRRRSLLAWGLYSLSVAIGLYTHPFYALTMVTHGFCVVLFSIFGCGKQVNAIDDKTGLPKIQLTSSPIAAETLSPALRWQWLLGYGVANIAALLLYSPWIEVLKNNTDRAMSTTDWARVIVGIDYLLKLWTLTFTSLFFDLDFGFDNPLTYLARLPFVALIWVAMIILYQLTPRATWIVVLKSILVPFLLLALPDLIMGGKRSAVSRYLISSFPGIQLAVAFLLAIGLGSGRQIGRWALALLFTASIISCGTSAIAETWWSKDLSYSNAEVAQFINTETPGGASTLVMSDIGDDYTNTGDLISLSYRLQDAVRLYLVKQPPDLEPLTNETHVLVFRPSVVMRQAILQKGWRLEMVSKPGRLWRLQQ
ncbi:MAG: glycosyltransferase family 39 protein [Drouetiella hepatica Uher 2000/2452]|jgi:uncharacterized membrane protein|uniref:Glycosyltransferase family 39 protein n=1 Tax=Drouetiella hepatica Uher 2000/2452 TaxID=904376 RepID=A0A951QDX3_9CYAN|nr:glycosyltransferase family 39 protein [Drouetiella hepatica Uher 2000/2452]